MSLIQVALVEDHTLTRLGMRTALEQTQKVKVVGDAANAHDGLQLLQTTKPDVAIVDVGLPDTDGIELTRKFREFQSTSGSRMCRCANQLDCTIASSYTSPPISSYFLWIPALGACDL